MKPVEKIGGISGVGGFDYFTPSVSVTKNNEARAASPEEKSDEKSNEVMQKKRLGIIECVTCENRTYQDGSDDPGVSFKAPTKLSPTEAASAVPAHEREHYNREAANAAEEDREVLSNSIRIFTSVCPECGKTYVSGGVTTTVTRKKDNDEEDFMRKIFGEDNDTEDTVFNLNLNIANAAYGLNFDERK